MGEVETDECWPIVHSVGDINIQAGFVLEERELSDYELVYFPEGTKTIYELKGEAVRLQLPCFIFTRPQERHLYRFDPDQNVHHLFVHFDYGAFRQRDNRFLSLLRNHNMILVRDDSLIPGIIKQMLRIANSQSNHWRKRLSVLLAAALEELCASADNAPEELAMPLPVQIARAIAYMQEHAVEPITIEQIAEQSGWTHEHFTRMFAAAVGMTPKRALLEHRLKRAEQLMMSGQLSVKQISYQVGFGDEHHFSKTYKRIRGITASEYIERCRNPLFRHTAEAIGAESPFSVNRHIVVTSDIK
ncbi:helix-turn-helix domain-containing protein [Paenibacillus solisilvae]|uniref:Helix-turn-helix domain-containing protein n=1 Tax=Paenibacillus solisilvae TaxID=2486751 RepID=A0ABW0VU74_9BACL